MRVDQPSRSMTQREPAEGCFRAFRMIVIPGVVHPHEIFHLMVLVGALFHWYFVWHIAAGIGRLESAKPQAATVALQETTS